MIRPDAFRDQPTLTGSAVRLEPLGSQHFGAMWQSAAEPEVRKLTGSHRSFTEAEVRDWVASRPEHHDRADWAIMRQQDDAVVGEAVLNEFSAEDESANFRIALLRPEYFGRGYGTEATRLVVGYGLDVAGLHRISLQVFDFNPRAQRVYEKCGFVREGVERDVLNWDGQWYDGIRMAILATDPR